MEKENVEQKVVYISAGADFSWATDYAKVKYGMNKYLQFPSDLPQEVQNIIPAVLSIESKHLVCVSAFEDKQMKDNEFLGFMIPTLQSIRKVALILKKVDEDGLSMECKETIQQLVVRSSLIIKTLKEYEIDVAEKSMGV